MKTLEHLKPLKQLKTAVHGTYWTLKWVVALSGVRFQWPVTLVK